MLELIDVSKVYKGQKVAVDGVTLRLGAGVLGLLGPNGAGKSSLMRVAATVTRPTAGRILFEGTDVVARPEVLRRQLGYLPQDFGVYTNLTAREFLSYLAAVKGLSARSARARVDELLALVNLTEAAKRPLGRYSGGMLRRVGIAQTLLTDPRVVIVDEPTAGLDPQERVRFRNLLSELAADRVVLLSTHIVSDIESVAGDIAIVAHGRLLSRGTPEQLLRAVAGQVWETVVAPEAVPAVQARHLVSRMVRTASGVRVRLLSRSRPDPDATLVPPDLEDAYLDVVAGVRELAR
jgi:ABC-type multidrug transport system ATPase subunit